MPEPAFPPQCSADKPAAGKPAAPDGVTVIVDGRPVSATKGEMLITVAERAGAYIPRFCHHPRLKPVGMCRMCLVDVKGLAATPCRRPATCRSPMAWKS